MGNILYVIALLLLVSWAVGFFVFEYGVMVHLLLMLAALFAVVQVVSIGTIKKDKK